MSERAPYSRVYWTVRNDPRLAGIYSDDHHWAAWNRLLLAADMAWPAPADLPAAVRRASLRALEAAGVIELMPGGLFCFHGLDGERGRRREAASASSAHRSITERGPDGDRTGTERYPHASLASRVSRAEPSIAEPSNAREPHIEAWLMARHRLPTQRQRDFLDRYLQVFDVTGPQRMAELILRHPDDPIAALKEDLDAHREQWLGELANGNPPPIRAKPKREPWQDMFKAVLEAKEAATIAARPLPSDEASA